MFFQSQLIQLNCLSLQIIHQYRCYQYQTKDMQTQKPNNKQLIYSIQVSGIKCNNCSIKIQQILEKELRWCEAKIKVNIMQDKVSLMINSERGIEQALELLDKIGYTAIGQPIVISGQEDHVRSIAFLVQDNEIATAVEQSLSEIAGIQQVKKAIYQKKVRVNVQYNCQVIKGHQLATIVGQIDPNSKAVNDLIDSFTQRNIPKDQQIDLKITIFFILYFFIFNVIFPIFCKDEPWYQNAITYPKAFGIFSFSAIFNFVVAMYIMTEYTNGYILRSLQKYCQFNIVNMETLIALGSVGAFSMFIFTLVKNTIKYTNGQLVDEQQFAFAVRDMNIALTTASFISLAVTIGKYLQSKAKGRIERLTNQVFPSSTMFNNMNVQWVETKNKKLKIVNERLLDVSLVQKDQIVRVLPGKFVLDAVVVQGKAKAVNNTRGGIQNVLQLNKGDRIQSGYQILEVQNCLCLVENVLEKSLLVEIGTQIKHSQNSLQNSSSSSGLQKISQIISRYFVKTVIIITILSAVVWIFIIIFASLDLPMCGLCWVLDRSITVLVASSPSVLGLAISSVIAIVFNMAARSQVLIKNTDIFDKIKKSPVVAFDKTGPLLTKTYKIQQHQIISSKYFEPQMWQIIALIEKQVRQPLADFLYKQGIQRSKIKGIHLKYILLDKPQINKSGISAKIMKRSNSKQMTVFIGNRNILINNGFEVSQTVNILAEDTMIFLAVQRQVLMTISLKIHSTLRPQAKQLISKLKQQKIDVHIFSNDSSKNLQQLGNQLDIPLLNQHSGLNAYMKSNWIQQIQSKGQYVIMIGDELNDNPFIKVAKIRVSINAKSKIHTNAADVVILSQNLYKILALVRLLKKGNIFININLIWALAYNIIMIPIATGVLYPLNFTISPVWSVIAMTLSFLLVLGFSQLLVLFKYDESLKDHSVKTLMALGEEEKEQNDDDSDDEREVIRYSNISTGIQIQLASHNNLEENLLL